MNYTEAIKIFEDGLEMREQIPLLAPAFETAISAMQELDRCNLKLKELYGECDGLLEKIIDSFAKYQKSLIMKTPFRSRLLTDEDADLWDEYKKLGTIEEVQDAVDRREPKKISTHVNNSEFKVGNVIFHKGVKTHKCQCGRLVMLGYKYCPECGQAIDWSDEE